MAFARSPGDGSIAVIAATDSGIQANFVSVKLSGEPKPKALAAYLIGICKEHSASTLLLDGPQGWKDPENGLEHSRICERKLNTPAKTGLPGGSKPANYLPFIAFSIEVFDALSELDRPRYKNEESLGQPVSVESFPLSAWRALGLPILPAKSKTPPSLLAQRATELMQRYGIVTSVPPSHDELQALVGGLAGPAIEQRNMAGLCISGVGPVLREGTHREGFIIIQSMSPCATLLANKIR